MKEIWGDTTVYRLTSAVAHGHAWAIHQLAFAIADVKEHERAYQVAAEGTVPVVKSVSPVKILFMLSWAFKAFAKPTYCQFRYFGWDLAKLRGVLESCAKEMGIDPNHWFWRE